MKLILEDANIAAVYGLPARDLDSDTVLKAYAARGWKDADTMAHIDAAIAAGAFVKQVSVLHSTRRERGATAPIITTSGDAQGEDN